MPFLLLLLAGSPALLSPAPGNRGSGDASICVGAWSGQVIDLRCLGFIPAPSGLTQKARRRPAALKNRPANVMVS